MDRYINKSKYSFTVVNKNTILYGLGAIKGVGKAAIENIEAMQEKHGDFKEYPSFKLPSGESRQIKHIKLELNKNPEKMTSHGRNKTFVIKIIRYSFCFK